MDERKKTIRFYEYTKKLLEQRQQERIKEDILNELNLQRNNGITSPTTPSSTEEARLLMEFMEQSNLFNVAKANEEQRKILILRRFFKMKRNQQVEVYSKCGTIPKYTEGKVSAVGRDFVMLTTISERIWIPYSAIDSANIPYGVPNYSNTHQHYIYDNDLRNKLLRNFGETVAKREVLKQQFYEEALQTNLNAWIGTWVEVHLDENKKKIGKIIESRKGKMIIAFLKEKEETDLKDISYIRSIRIFSIVGYFFKKLRRLKEK